jgi:hypothetical protein
MYMPQTVPAPRTCHPCSSVSVLQSHLACLRVPHNQSPAAVRRCFLALKYVDVHVSVLPSEQEIQAHSLITWMSSGIANSSCLSFLQQMEDTHVCNKS